MLQIVEFAMVLYFKEIGKIVKVFFCENLYFPRFSKF